MEVSYAAAAPATNVDRATPIELKELKGTDTFSSLSTQLFWVSLVVSVLMSGPIVLISFQ